jgi:peptidyl-prolyl cis-trans isomerase C
MKKINLYTGVFVLALAVALAGCSKGSDSAAVAKVNGTTITAADFKKQLEELNPQLQQAVAMDPAARKEFLENQILTELLVQEAKKQGLDKEDAYKKSMEMHKKEAEDNKKKIDQRLQDIARYELLNSVLKKEVGDKISQMPAPTDKEVRDYYSANKDRIRAALGKQVSLKEIEPRIKAILVQEKQSKLSLDYAKGLKAKASVTVDDKALEAAMAEPSRAPDMPDAPKAPATKEGNKK